jgi:hypothetical protein
MNNNLVLRFAQTRSAITSGLSATLNVDAAGWMPVDGGDQHFCV